MNIGMVYPDSSDKYFYVNGSCPAYMLSTATWNEIGCLPYYDNSEGAF